VPHESPLNDLAIEAREVDAASAPHLAAPGSGPIDKAILRTQLLALRRALGADAARDRALAQRVAQLLAQRTPRCVGFYWPIAGEFDLRALIAEWLATHADAQAALPVVEHAAAPLLFHAWHDAMPMREGRHRIPVPLHAQPVQPDLLLIPCVGFDTRRVRLGYGGGYYDRTLATLAPRPYTAGIAFEATRLASLPREAHDVPLDTILSEAARY
jgi:5-formyltetrahydrofolate cyclo-ligase